MMNIAQLYTGCLAQGAYFIESDGEAAVIDPLRESGVYLDLAKKANAQIKYIFETHFHADFVSGHLELAEITGAPIVYGPNALTSFKAYIGHDEEVFTVGKLRIKLLHTPGHTLESSCYLVVDQEGKAAAVFTGDTLFIGDVGRPDLAQQPVEGLTKDHLAGMLYDSLRNKIMTLPDDIMVYPAHGAGSACGKNMSKETSDTIGNQKKTNYALDPKLSRGQFIADLLDGLKPAPAYFPMNVQLNSQGYQSLTAVLEKGMQSLDPAEIRNIIKGCNVIVLDTRDPAAFAAGHIPGAVNIGLSGTFAPWVGALLPFENTKIILVTEKGREHETVTRLARIGYEMVIGYLQGGIASWIAAGNEISQIACIAAEDFAKLNEQGLHIIDVRNEAEFNGGALPGALHYPLADFDSLHHLTEEDKTYYVYCAGGYRSMMYISMLKAIKPINLININGGYGAIRNVLKAV
jgi:hydroxyacylglutathione hydrolase